MTPTSGVYTTTATSLFEQKNQRNQSMTQIPSCYFSTTSGGNDDDEGTKAKKVVEGEIVEGEIVKEKNESEEKEEASTPPPPPPPEPVIKNQQTMEFQAETKQLLDIVTHSLYTD